MKRVKLLALSLASIFSLVRSLSCGRCGNAPEPFAERAIIITVDGLASWVLKLADAPNIRQLMNHGCYTLNARTVRPSATLPAHVSLFTAVPPSVHGFDFDSYIPERGYVQRRTLFTFARAKGLSTAMIVGKKKLFHIANPNWVNYAPRIKRANATKILNAALECLKQMQPHVLFIHFPEPDWVGHERGWGSKAQLDEVRKCDAHIGAVVKALKEFKMWDRALLVITADHGGHGRWHYGKDERDLLIPLIFSGGAVKQRGELSGKISICDVAPTVAYALSLPMPEEWAKKIIKSVFPGEKGSTQQRFDFPRQVHLERFAASVLQM
ncbi:MAG: alkaline phosphatase family protein [Armatimonadota bacterium]|nr:alkaline phosphatase family protein [Armatimonadota bacterium]MCX7776488.1 alkaline phosphatase family protein [Armatimonadota bacterium]MDW8024285.1 alkaline phosphatase family protein [Armatimonadota bacterium]